MRIFVRPGSDQALTRHAKVFEQPRDRVRVGIRPAADGENRAGDGIPILAHRAVPPISVAPLMAKPGRHEQRHRLQPLEPHAPPSSAHGRRIGGIREDGGQDAGPAEIGGQQRAAHEMHVVGVAIVGGADRDDGPQRRRTERGDLQRVEAAPGNPHHADRARAPVLARDPGDHLHRVVQLLRGILVAQQAVGLAAAAQIDSHPGVATRGEPGIRQRVAVIGAVALAIGQVFQDRRDRRRLRRQPDPRREPCAVGERNPGVVDIVDVLEAIRHPV